MIRINLLMGYLSSGGRRIPLSQGQSTIVDDEDFGRISAHKWYARWDQSTQSFYAARKLPREKRKQTTQHMHREIMGLESGDHQQIDHLNHDTLDNRKENLRIVTNRKNSENRCDQSEYGVGVRKDGKRFQARARVDGHQVHLGMFCTLEEAQEARVNFLKDSK